MGVDYSANEAVVLDAWDMVKIINGANKKHVVDILQGFHDNIVADEHTSAEAKLSVKVFDGISPRAKLAEIRHLLVEYHNVEGEAGTYEGNCWFANGLCGDELMELWERIIEASGCELPTPYEITIFDSYRKHANCQIGVASFLFAPDDCYERTLSEQGKALEKMSGGYLAEVSWTEVSY